jgi:hypothetical protein
MERDRIGEMNTVEPELTSKESDNCSRSVIELVGAMSSERNGVRYCGRCRKTCTDGIGG